MEPYSQPDQPKSIKGKVILSLVIVIVLFLGYWLSQVSFVEFSVPQNGSYTFSNQANQKQKLGKTSGTVKLRVSRGSYELTIKDSSGQKSYFALAQAKGFLRKTTVETKADLRAEKQRTFIGNNPDACMNLLNQSFISYSCGGSFSNIKYHVAANVNTPSYVDTKVGDQLPGTVEAVFKSGSGYLALLAWPSLGDSPAGHYLYRLNDRLETSNETLLENLKGSKNYSIQVNSNGFVAYDTDLESAHYYNTEGLYIKSLKLGRAEDKKLSPVFMDAGDKSLISLFSSDSEDKSEVVITESNQSRRYVLGHKYTSARLCGESRVCLVGDSKLDVYDISGKKAKKLYYLTNVFATEPTANGFLVIRSSDILNFETDKGHGFIEYSLSDYKYNSIQTVDGGYLLNLSTPTRKKVALLIDQSADNKDDIDKKVLNLVDATGVTSISAYKNLIFISPDLGDPDYFDESGLLDYKPEIKRAAAKLVEDMLRASGIDRNVYQVITLGI